MKQDYHELPKIRDSISYIYIEHAIIEQDNSSIMLVQKDGTISIPIAATTCLLVGPGTTITHASIRAICDNGCMIVWCGEKMRRFYAFGSGETRSAANLLLQAELCMNPDKHLEVAKRMYLLRFPNFPKGNYSLQQLRGMEGIRVREAYKNASSITGVSWKSRSYKTSSWDESDPINQALSEANALLYNICQAAIISLGYSPALGFIHTGKQLSFVYDISDLYKAEISIPAAFEAVKNPNDDLSKTVRTCCRAKFESTHLLKRISDDIAWVFSSDEHEQADSTDIGALWDDEEELVSGGQNYAKG